MQQTTLCLLIKDKQICLATKKRGFGLDKWNGLGGKVSGGESIEEAAVREVKEEAGVLVRTEGLKKIGEIKFYFREHPDWAQHMHVFIVEQWFGEPQESDEMKPAWHPIDSLPIDHMWLADKHWLPMALHGKRFFAEFHYKGKGESIEKFSIKEI